MKSFHVGTLTSALCAVVWLGAARGAEIHTAAKEGDFQKVKALLKASPALVGLKNDAGETPLHQAAFTGNKAMVKLLLSKQADVKARTTSSR